MSARRRVRTPAAEGTFTVTLARIAAVRVPDASMAPAGGVFLSRRTGTADRYPSISIDVAYPSDGLIPEMETTTRSAPARTAEMPSSLGTTSGLAEPDTGAEPAPAIGPMAFPGADDIEIVCTSSVRVRASRPVERMTGTDDARLTSRGPNVRTAGWANIAAGCSTNTTSGSTDATTGDETMYVVVGRTTTGEAHTTAGGHHAAAGE